MLYSWQVSSSSRRPASQGERQHDADVTPVTAKKAFLDALDETGNVTTWLGLLTRHRPMSGLDDIPAKVVTIMNRAR
jgi:hypothetical protein